MSKDCIFCRIVRNELPSWKILEDNEFLAFLDIHPISYGHVLIVPKKHCENIMDFPKSEETDLIEFIKRVAKAVELATGCDGFNLGLNNGEAAGQIIHHAHFHIIPRYKNDKLSNWPNKEYKEGDIDDMQKKIKKFLS